MQNILVNMCYINVYFVWNSAYDYAVGPLNKAIVKTDIQIAVPRGCYGRVGEWLLTVLQLQLYQFFSVA